MKISDYPKLKEYRDELARAIQAKRGGTYLDAVSEANATTNCLYAAAKHEAGLRKPGKGVTNRDISESVARVVTEVRRTLGVTELNGEPQSGKQQREAMIREAVQRAVEGASGNAATPESRPLHEISDDELMDRVGEAMAARVTAFGAEITEGGPAGWGAQSVTESELLDNALTPEQLRGMSADDFLDHFGAVMSASVKPRVPSPFWRGLS